MGCFYGPCYGPCASLCPADPSSCEVHLISSASPESSSWSMRFEDFLTDDFAYDYLLRFATAEHSSENVLLLRQADEFFVSGQASDELKHSLMTVGLPGKTRRRLSDWVSSDGDGVAFPVGAPPADVVSEAFRLCYKVVRHDVFPRFVQSEHHREMGALHLSHMLRNAGFRAAFLPTLAPRERELAEFWHAASAWREQHTSLASGWASEQTIEEAKAVWARHAAAARALDAAADAARMLDARLFEGPSDLFCEMQVIALNQLRAPYEHFLATPPGAAMLKASGFKRMPMPPSPPPAAAPLDRRPSDLCVRPSGAADDYDYAAGW